MWIRKTADGRWIPEEAETEPADGHARWIPEETEKEPADGHAIALNSTAVQDLIRMLVNDTMKEKDRTVTIRVDPDGAISVSIYPTIN